MNQLLILKDQVRTAFETLNVPLKTWGSEELLNTLYSLLSPDESLYNLGLKWDSMNPLSHQMTSKIHDYKIEKDEIVISKPTGEDWHLRSYSVQQQPDYWSLSAMTELIGDFERDPLRLKVPFLIHYGIHISPQEKTKVRVQSRESWVEQQSYSKIGKRIPILKKQARELNLVREHLSRGERFVETNLTVSLISPKGKVEEAESTLMSLFRSNKWNLQRDVYLQLQLFLSHLPMFWGEGMVPELKYNNRLKTTISTESSNLLPIQGEWKGTHSPGMIFAGRRGQIFNWSPFDNTGGNYNVTVVGSSGSGKSVFMQELMTSTLGIGGRVFVLDVGRSFEKVSHLLRGEFVEFSSKNPVCINPFSFIPENDPEAASDFLGMMKPIVSLMAAPTGGTTDLENAQIERAISEAWTQKGTSATMTDVSELLLSRKEAVSQELGQKLFPYTKNGVYGRFFEGAATINLHSNLVVVELEELKERKDLQSVVVQIMILHITNNLYLGDRKTPTSIILDEAWDMLRAPQSGVFIETCARRLRKYNGSLVVGTQSVNDFYTTPGAQAAFDNSDWMIMLSQKAESIEMLKRTGRVKVEGLMESYLRSLKTKAGKYAECMIYGPHGFAIGRLLLDPFSMILYSTKADEYALVKDLIDQGLTLENAISRVAGRRAS